MAFQLVEAETGQPLARAKLHLFYLLADGRGKVVKATTDAYGSLGVDQPQAPYRALNLFVTADGHVPKVTSWGFERGMPAEYTMKLERGVTIGGVVVDEAGQPIAGAKVGFEGPGNDMSLAENHPVRPRYDDHYGCQWPLVLQHDPEDVGADFLGRHSSGLRRDQRRHPAGAPDAHSSVITMPAGFSVAGTVQNAFGHPVQGARSARCA